MSTSLNLHTYTDVEQVLQAAREQGGAIYELTSHAQAVAFRRRVYTYRKLLGQQAAALGPTPQFMAPTKWDDVSLEVRDTEVVIRFNYLKGQIKTLTGDEVGITTRTPKKLTPIVNPDDPLLLVGLELAKDIQDDDD